ncbi:MAG: universal stress protein [bacterium]|nr:MAG: universal stress protein [bacterium]
MPAVKKVLFPTDFSELANHALPYAIKFAKIFNAELIMLHAVTLYEHDPNDPEHHFPSLQSYCSEVRGAADNGFMVCIEQIGDAGVKVVKVIVQGISPHAAILDYLNDENDIGMIVMSTHGRSGLSHVLLGSVTENVIRYAHCPVLVVKQPEHEFIDPETGEVHLKKILFPLDFSKDSLKPIDLLREIAGMHDSEIIVFHAVDVEIPPIYYTTGIESILQLDPDLNERVARKMEAMVGEKLEGLNLRYEVTEGRAVDRIRELASGENIDLIIMGTAGSHGIGDFLFGSTAARVIQKTVCPVLAV